MTEPTAPGVRVEAGLLPWPRGVSAEARAFLARTVMPDGSPHPRAPRPAPGNVAGWIANRDATDAMLAAQFGAAAPPAASVERIEVAGTRVDLATPDDGAAGARVFLHLHGGGWIYGGGAFCAASARRMAATTGLTTFGLDYRKPPEQPYPAALDDCVALFRALIDRYGAENILVGGGSAGGNLAAALALRARAEGLPMPAGLVLLTPVLDCTESGDSAAVNAAADTVLSDLAPLIRLYAGGEALDHPYLSPLFGDLAGFPPTFLQAGSRDVLLSDSARMHQRLLNAGAAAELHVFDGMPHGGFGGAAPEDRAVDRAVARFVAKLWG